MSPGTIVAILVFLTLLEGSIVGHQGVNLRCLCITKERKPIGRHIAALEVYPPASHCAEKQVIATLKNGTQKVCLDPDAPWLKKLLENRRTRQKGKP